MKRASEASQSLNTQEKHKVLRRQNPVSCQFCRKKKLKCDRATPCSSCRARRLSCSNSTDLPVRINENASSEVGGFSRQNIDELNSRVRKLEEILRTNWSSQIPAGSTQPRAEVQTSYNPKHQVDDEDEQISRTVCWIETDAFEYAPLLGDHTVAAERRVAENFASFIFSHSRTSSPNSLDINYAESLPTRIEALTLLEYYFEHINWIYHIIHIPTVRSICENIYTNIENNRQLDYGHLALILTIFALSAYYASPSAGLYFNMKDARELASRWTLLAQQTLTVTRCLTFPTIETLQSLMLIVHHLMPNIGTIATLRTLSSMIVQLARGMSLHTMDSPTNKKRPENTPVDWVEIEVKRRLWWHIASTDWMVSFMDGARSGTYTIHPQQMHVDLPTNVDDPDINSIGDYAKPLDIPTDMTFFIFRAKSSIVFRELVDDAWQSGVDLHALPYDMVLQYDKKFRNMLADVEKAFSSIAAHTNAAGKQMLPGPDGQYRHTLWRQRNLAHFGMHSRFCLLHRPYLVRGSQEPQYAYSRMMCLKSARGVIETGKMLISLNPDMAALKVWVLNYHIFVSTVVLVMDFCFNPDEPRAKERKEEIIECYKLFENGPEGSTLAARGLQKLRAILCDKKSMQYKPCINIGRAKMDRAPSSSQGPLETEVPTKTGMETTYPFDPISTGYTFGSVNDVPLQSSMNFDYSALENINWDMNTDIGLFDELLQTVDYNGDTF